MTDEEEKQTGQGEQAGDFGQGGEADEVEEIWLGTADKDEKQTRGQREGRHRRWETEEEGQWSGRTESGLEVREWKEKDSKAERKRRGERGSLNEARGRLKI